MSQDGSFSDLDAIEKDALAAVEAAGDAEALDQVRIQVLGKKGSLKQILRNLGGLTPEERPLFGARANVVKEKVQAALDEAKSRLGSPAKQGVGNSSATEDLTLPGLMPQRGSRHPVRLVMARMSRIFASLGFEVADGPEVEDEWHNFNALNIPADHPGRIIIEKLMNAAFFIIAFKKVLCFYFNFIANIFCCRLIDFTCCFLIDKNLKEMFFSFPLFCRMCHFVENLLFSLEKPILNNT